MQEPPTITDLTALWGAITGTAGLIMAAFSFIVAYLAYNRDKADVKLTMTKNWTITGALPFTGYDRNATYLCISVANKGRRPVTITKVAAIFLKMQGGFIFSDSMIYGSRELKEGKSVDNLVKQNETNLSEISYFAAYDAVGNTYKLYQAPLILRVIYNVLHTLYIRRKPLLSTQRRGRY